MGVLIMLSEKTRMCDPYVIDGRGILDALVPVSQRVCQIWRKQGIDGITITGRKQTCGVRYTSF